ncbi:MAG: hypothetical protein ACLR5S_11125 [Ruminococcus sp.]
MTKVIILGKEDFEKLSEDVSPDYPFLKDNRELMSADPGGLFRCLMVRTKGEQEEYMLIAQGETAYTLVMERLPQGKPAGRTNRTPCAGRTKSLSGTRCILPPPMIYQISMVRIQDYPAPERQTEFRVEQVVVLADEEYRQFQETDFCKTRFSCLITKTRCGSIPAVSAGTVYW